MKNHKKLIMGTIIMTTSIILLSACSEEVKDDISLKENYESDLSVEELHKFKKGQEENEKLKERYSYIYDEELRENVIGLMTNMTDGALAYTTLISTEQIQKESRGKTIYEAKFIYPTVDNKNLYAARGIGDISLAMDATMENANYIINYDTSRLVEDDTKSFEELKKFSLQVKEHTDLLRQLYLGNKSADYAVSFYHELNDNYEILLKTATEFDLTFQKYLEKENGIVYENYLDETVSMEEIKEEAKESDKKEIKDNIYKPVKKTKPVEKEEKNSKDNEKKKDNKEDDEEESSKKDEDETSSDKE